MDGENNGKPYFLMDDLGGKPPIFGNTHINPINLSPEAWSAASGHKVQELMASWTEQMGYLGDLFSLEFGEFVLVGFGLGWVGLVGFGFCFVGWVGWFWLGLVGFGWFGFGWVGFIFNWGNGFVGFFI